MKKRMTDESIPALQCSIVNLPTDLDLGSVGAAMESLEARG